MDTKEIEMERSSEDLRVWIGGADFDKWSRTRVGIGVKAPCANFCRFCERKDEILSRSLKGTRSLPRNELIEGLREVLGCTQEVEFVVTGGE